MARPPAWVHTGFAQRIVFGGGAVARLPEVLRATGARRWLLVTTEGRLASDEGTRFAHSLGRSVVSTFAEVRSHVPTTAVEAAVRQARRDAIDGVVSFGGGSCCDLGKAVCFFLEQESGAPGVEVAYSPARTPEAEAVGLACVAAGADALPRVVDDPGDREARADMLAA